MSTTHVTIDADKIAELRRRAPGDVNPDTGEIFDGSQYDLPIPSKDGHKADALRIAIGGSVDLDLYDNDALQFLDSLKLGDELTLTVTCRVAGSGWKHGLKGDDAEDHVVYQVGLKAHSIDLPKTGE